MDITELTEIDAERVDGVGAPANGTAFLLIKQVAEAPVAEKGTDVGDLLDDLDQLSDDLDDLCDQDSADDSDPGPDTPDPAVQATKADDLPDGVVKAAPPFPPAKLVTCPTCKGTGKVRGNSIKCPDCAGTGKVTPAKAKTLAAPAAKAELEAVIELLGDDTVTKAGRRLSSATVTKIRSALDALAALLGADGTGDNSPAPSGGNAAKEEINMTTEELEIAVKDALAADVEARAARKAEKKAAKAVKKADKAAKVVASAPEADEVTKAVENDAPVVAAEDSEQVALLKSIAASVQGQEERLAKVEATPRQGGPLLNGQVPDPTIVLRGANSSADAGLDALEKMVAEERDPARQAEMRIQFAQARMTDFYAKGGQLPRV